VCKDVEPLFKTLKVEQGAKVPPEPHGDGWYQARQFLGIGDGDAPLCALKPPLECVPFQKVRRPVEMELSPREGQEQQGGEEAKPIHPLASGPRLLSYHHGDIILRQRR
jgi:hypothetical protein